MKKRLQLAALPLFLGVLMLPGNAIAWEDNVCYRWDIFPFSRIRVVMHNQRDLTTWEEEWNFGHPHQAAMSVMGKGVNMCSITGDTRPLVGSVIFTDPEDGARLGLEIFTTTGFPHTCKDVEVNCRASNLSTWPPSTWDCYSGNKFGIEHPPSQLIQVDPTTDPLCSVFEALTVAPLIPDLPVFYPGGPLPPVPLR